MKHSIHMRFFNSHPHKEDDWTISCLFAIVKLFNSHPHKEDDFGKPEQLAVIAFSTHILTRRMTMKVLITMRQKNFSTHILTRRMTNHLATCTDFFNFQLTSSQGGWLTAPINRSLISAFQLTSSQGGWHIFHWTVLLHILFNSHPHKEDDNKICLKQQKKKFFNSHPHKEDDQACKATVLSNNFSTHILTRRMTSVRTVRTHAKRFSTHILTRRMTATLNKNTLSKTARIIPFEYNTLKIYIFSNSYLLFFWKSTPFSGANLPEDFCALIIRTKISKYP